MRKYNILAAILFVAAAILVCTFGILLWRDYTVHYPYGSAPFYVYVVERAIEFLLPAGLCTAGGIAVKKASQKTNTHKHE